ncbi:MAG: hypothetical protein IJP15_06140 [Oscillospiraceae bacterium]|nr:hypothetical protein [Oscillospiraceae bacterium]
MKKFESMTKYLPLLENDKIGTWVIDRENDGTPEHPFHMPFVDYSEMVRSFIRDVHEFHENNKDFELTHYSEILEKNGLKWDSESMSEADVSDLDSHCVMALLMAAVRAERFCDGALLDFFENGSMKKWLTRLQEIDAADCTD